MNRWWHKSVVYQIYPKSFMDSNNDGVGDVRGIISKLDYLKELGIDIIWLSPVYKSPMDDNGYDISDYLDIAEEFGTMEDVEELINEAKNRGIKIIMDLVANHTSDEHKWFLKSKESKDSEYRDFYIWRDGNGENPPSDMKSFFGGSAWEYDEKTNQYYLHMFSKKQPDLNWDNEVLRNKMYEMINFWIDKGISGFRLDAIELIGKDIDKGTLGNDERTHRFLKEMNEKTFGPHDLFTVGETGAATVEDAKIYSDKSGNELSMVFQFNHIALDEVLGKGKWNLKDLNLVELKKVLSKWQVGLIDNGWNSLYWNNHDQPRIVSRWGNDKEFRVESAKMLATLLHTMQGTPYIYQGEEIGMTNAYFDDINDYKDIETINLYNEKIEEGWDIETLMTSIKTKGRDNARTPFQWNDGINGGFTKGEPWIKVNPNYKNINAEEAVKDQDSIFNYYKKLIKLRKTHDIIVYGEYKLILENDENIFAFTRELNGEKLLVINNFYEKEVEFILPNDIIYSKNELLISNYDVKSCEINKIKLRPYESRVYKLSN